MEQLQRITKNTLIMISHYIDFILFIILITLKLFIFAQLSGTVFVKQGFLEYITIFIDWIFGGGQELLTELRQGLVMVSVGAVLLTAFWVLFLPRRARIVTFFVLNLVLSFIIFADLVYYRYFEDLISTNVLMQAGQVSSLGESISSLFSVYDWLFFLDLIVFLPAVIFLFIKIPKKRAETKNWIARFAAGILTFVVGYILVFYPIQVFIDKGGSYLFQKTLSNMRVYEKTGLLGFHGFDLNKFYNEEVLENDPLTAAQKESDHEWFEKHSEISSQNSELTGLAKGKNVIVVQLEAFENYLIDKKVDGQEITPNLNDLKDNSMYFNNFYHQTANGRTSDAEFLVNTSLYPLYSGSAFIKHSDNTYTALPEILKEQGYSTSVFHAYKKSFWNRYLMYPSLGIEKFYSLDYFEKVDPVGWSISDESMFNQSFEQIKTFKQPFYTMLISLTAHHPYDIPDKFKMLEINSLKDQTFKNYLQSQHYVDYAVGQFIQQLKDEGLWESSVVIFYGDHDSALLENEGEIAEFVGVANDPLKYLQYKEEVPLLIHLPDEKVSGTFEQVGGQIDLGPTILDLLGIKADEQYMMGTSLFKEGDQLVVFRDGSFTTEQFFYNASIDGVFKNGTCYDTVTGEETSLQACQPFYQDAIKELHVSDDVLSADLIEEWLK